MLRYLPGARVKSIALFTAIFALQLLAASAIGQTDPTPQSLPYTQAFSTFDGGSTTYPAGWQGWSNATAISTTVITAAATGDQSLFAGQSNATTGPFVGDMVNKMGLLSGTSVKSICLALNTTSVTSGNVQLIYTAATQGQTIGGFIDELDLQYRIGTSGAFTTISTAAYRNDALTTTTTGGTTASNPSTFYVLLPAACNNQATVEIRWIPRNVSGSGTTHPGFSIANITARQNTTTDYYSKASGALDNPATWTVNADGSAGSAPSNFTTDNQVFHISNGNAGFLGATWVVSGANSKIVVDGTNLSIVGPVINGTVDVNAGRTLTLASSTLPTLGTLDAASTVVFSGLSGVAIPVVTPAYGNIVFNNSTVAIPGATQLVTFAGNFTLQGTSSFLGAGTTLGYTLASYGNGVQTVNANGRPLTIWTLDVGRTNAKTFGTFSLAANTNMTLNNSLIMVLNGTAPQFFDGGDTITILNNLDCGGAASAYNFTGTISLSIAAGSGACNIRGGGTPSLPCVAAVNNLILNNGQQVKVNPNGVGITFTVKGTLTTTSSATAPLNLQGNTIAIGGNYNYANTNAALLTLGGTSTFQFNGTGAQTYSCIATGGLTFTNLTMSNTGSGLTLAAPLAVTGITTLTSGVITTGTNVLSIGNAGSVSGGSASSYVKGNLSKAMLAAGSTSMAYETGDLTYSPIKLTFGSSQNSGSIAVKSTSGSHPSMATSYISTANFVNRYWSITTTSVNPATVDVALSYNSSDITSGLGSNANYIIRKYSGSAWTTGPSETNTTSAAAPLLAYASATAGVSGTSFAGDYVAGAPDCTPAAGTTIASPATICGSGTTTLSISGATTNTGNAYQWQSSPDGSAWTNITGATAATYTSSVIATSTFYRAITTCIPTAATVNAVSAQVTVNALPPAISGTLSGCLGFGATLSDAAGAGTWSSGNASVATIGSGSGTYSTVSAGTATITYTAPVTGCKATAVLTVSPTPPSPVISPLLVTLCPGSPAQLITTSGDTVSTSYTGSSGTISVPMPYNVAATSTIPVSGIPAGAIITNVAVTFSTSYDPGLWQQDYVFNLQAPNGNIINLHNGGGSSVYGAMFTDVSIGSAGTTPITSATMTSGTLYAAALASGAPSTVGFTPAGLISNTTSWSNLYSIANGNWKFIADDKYSPIDNLTSILNWSITISYLAPPTITWSPVAGLYTDAGAGTSYTGTNAPSIYAKPILTTTYNVTAAIGTCTNSSTVVALFNSTIYVPAISGPSTVCAGASITLTDTASGGTWTSSGAATVGSASGVVTGTGAGTATIVYTYTSGSCTGTTSRVITVNPQPSVSAITGNTGLCFTGTPTTTLSDASAGGTWSSGNTAVATIVGSSGVVTGIAPGSAVISYTYSDGICSNSAITTVNVYSIPSALTISPSSATICAGSAPQTIIASGGTTPGGTVSVSTGTISVDLSAVHAIGTAAVNVTGVPSSAVITGVSVTMSFNSNFLDDYQFNLVAPNGSIVNLINQRGPHSTASFTNTILSSAGVTPLSSGTSPFTGTFAADLLTNTIPGYATTVNSWTPLYSVPNGVWTLVGYNNTTFANTPTTLTKFAVTVNYAIPVPATWAPLSGLYTSSLGGAYTGAATDTVYSSPATTTVYTVTSTNGACSSSTTFTMSVNSSPSAILGATSLCQGAAMVLSDLVTGGTWGSSNSSVATIGSTGLVLGSTAGTTTISYQLSVSCTAVSVITVNASTPILGTLSGCLGAASISLSDATAGGSWSSTNTAVASVGTGSGLVTIGSIPGTSTISYVLPSGCTQSKVVTVTPVPAAPLISPSVISLCPSSPAQQLVAYGDSILGPKKDSTGLITATLFSVTPTASTININGIPSGAVITRVRATINGHGTGTGNSKQFNYAFNLKAPNGSIVSLINGQGSSGLSDFPYITFGSDGTTSITATPLVTGVNYIANLSSTPVPTSIPSGSRSNTPNWTSLYTVPNGNWTLIGAAVFNSASGLDTLKGWSLSIDYYLPPTSVIWSPVTGLYTNSAGTTAYTGTSAGTVYAAPSVTTTYNVTAAISGCTSSPSSVVANVSSTLFVAPISGAGSVCIGANIQLSDATVGGTWSTLSSNVTVGSTGIVTGVSASPGTATITYTYTSGACSGSATKVVSVNDIPALTPITGNTNLCLGGSSSSVLSNATTGGTWSSSSSAVATIGTSGTLTGFSVGTSVITYTYSNAALCTNRATTTVTVLNTPSAVTVSPTSASMCPGDPATMLVASGAILSGSATATTGPINLDASGAHSVTVSSLPISGIPAGATITSVAVTLNFSSSFLADFMFELQAPNGSIINLVNQPGGPHAASYTNTILSSNGVTALSSGSSPFTGTFAADLAPIGVTSVIPTYSATATNWSSLYGTPNGNWTLAAYNTFSLTTTSSFLTGYAITINYTLPIATSWTPATGLYTDAGATTSYVGGTFVNTVYAAPASGINTYSASAGNGACASAAGTATITVNAATPAISGNLNVCIGTTTSLSDATSGGTWSTASSNVSVGTSGVVTGAAAGTATITYTPSTGCFVTAVVTVSSSPGSITGTLSVCQGSNTQLADAGSGTWSSSNANASVSATGLVTGNIAGTTATITYTASAGCFAIADVTVNANPGPINGVRSVCAGLTTQLTDALTGGTWASANAGIATVGSSTGIVTGNVCGTAIITYTLATGCINTAEVTVNCAPGSINGNLSVCQGLTTQLTDAFGTGTWSSDNISVASVGSSSGLVLGNAAPGTATIKFTLLTGCNTQAIVTVNSLPAPISGTRTICRGATSTLSDISGGGTWSSNTTSVATIGSADGVVFGVTAGTAIITYTSGVGCVMPATVTVNPLPAVPSGAISVCEGATTQFTDADAGGTWSSGIDVYASVGTGGLVTGNIGGTFTSISYTLPTGCSSHALIAVSPLPDPISGTFSFCQGSTVAVSDATTGGTWSSSDAGVVSIGSATGSAFGASAGNATITYTSTNGCIRTIADTVNAVPDPISGASPVCQGHVITLSDAIGGGLWSYSSSIISVDGSGNVTGLSAGTAGVTYTLGGVCSVSTTITVNVSPSPISGANAVCVGSTITLSDAGSGTWAASNSNVTVTPTGLVAGANAGTSVVTYEIASGCIATTVVTVNDAPSAILGTPVVSVGYTTTLSDAGAGVWSVSGSVATIGSTSGIVTGVAPGTADVTYTLGNTCFASVTVTVTAAPPVITGVMKVCVGSTTLLVNTGAGTWASSNANATIGSASGIVTGVTAGTSVITYKFDAGGEVYAIVTVDPLPSSITGPDAVCIGSVITLSDATVGGTWSSSSNATVGTTGIVTGVTAGTATVSYTLATTGCAISKTITVNALPGAISGSGSVCVGSAITLTDIDGGGTWVGSNANVTVGSSSGLVSGIAAGSSIITYTLPTGCFITRSIVVNALPGAILGGTNVCVGSSTTLSDAGSGTWSSSNGNVTINVETGVATGVTAGTSVITYTLSSGCFITTVVTANAVVTPSVSLSKTTGDTICSGTSVIFTAALLNGGSSPEYEWSVNGTTITGATTDVYSSVPADGNDIVTVTVTSNVACALPATVSAADTLTVIHTDTSAVTISVGPNDTVCLGSYALFTAIGANGGSAPVYTWSVNGAQVSTGIAYGYMPADGDNVYCTLVSSLRCIATATVTSNHIVMSVDTSYIPTVDIIVTPGTSVSSTQTVTFHAVVSNAGPVVNYQWFINTTPIPGATSSAFTHAYFANNDSVSCGVVSVGPCGYASFNAVKMHVIRTDVQQVPNGLNDIRLIPNPNKGQFNIKGLLASGSTEDIAVEITDMLGQVVYKSTVRSVAGNIDEQISLHDGIANGMYLLSLHTGSENIVFHFVVGQ